MTRRMLLLIGLVALLALATNWLSRKSESRPPKSAAARHIPDYFIKGLESTVTDTTGRPSHQLRADALLHYPDDDTTELERPDITVLGNEKASRWHATAERGKVESQQHQILLVGNVRLKQYGSSKMSLQTDWLRINSEQHYAETRAPVTLQSAGTQLQGIGMKAYGDEQRLQLLSEVRGQYAAN